MKKIFIATVVLLFAFMLSAVEKKVNFVWKDTGRSFSDFRTYSFGFREKGDEYCFAFQIKNLKQLMEDKDSMLVCCMDTDNNEKSISFDINEIEELLIQEINY